jgi:hypothetical protein
MNRENRRYFFSVFLFLTLNKILHEMATRLGALHDYRRADGPHQTRMMSTFGLRADTSASVGLEQLGRE